MYTLLSILFFLCTMRNILLFIGFFFLSLPSTLAALPGQINLRSEYLMFTIPTRDPQLWEEHEFLFFHNTKLLLSDSEAKKLPLGSLEKRKEKIVNEVYIADFLKTNIAPHIFKTPQGSKLSFKDNIVQFDGDIFQGKELNIPLSVSIIAKALRENIDEVELAVNNTEPDLQIPEDIKQRGITEVIAIGESDFTGSSESRIFNFWHGASRFQGQILPKGADISFNSILGEVGEHTGYKKELVIKGDETLPDWGGGICQVSSTLYRGVMLAGLPILERSNHSYSVSYYSPAGSDATIYPGSHDLRFKNDTDGDMAIQVHKNDTKLYFVLLGTKSQKQVDLFGPYITNPLPTPPTKFLPSKVLAANTKLLISPAHKGFTSTWFRNRAGNVEKYVSRYESRPQIYKVGGLKEAQEGILE